MDVLVARTRPSSVYQQQSSWCQIRPRWKHRNFSGEYRMCTREGNVACDAFSCTFAHNEVEKLIWSMEKMNEFDITRFITSNRTSQVPLLSTVREIINRYPVSLACESDILVRCFGRVNTSTLNSNHYASMVLTFLSLFGFIALLYNYFTVPDTLVAVF